MLHIKFQHSEDGYGAILPFDADFHIEPYNGADDTYEVHWRDEDDVSDMSGWSSSHDGYDHGAYVDTIDVVDVETLVEHVRDLALPFRGLDKYTVASPEDAEHEYPGEVDVVVAAEGYLANTPARRIAECERVRLGTTSVEGDTLYLGLVEQE